MYANEEGIKPCSEVYFNTPSNNAQKLFFYVISAGIFVYENTYILNRENYNSFLVMYILDGRTTIFYENKNYIAYKGDIVFLNCYKKHGYRAEGNLKTIWFHFDGNISEEYFNMVYEKLGCVISSDGNYKIKNQIYEIFDLCKKESINEVEMFSRICAILSSFLSVPQNFLMVKNNNIKEITEYINCHYAENLSIEELSKKVMLSKYYFIRTFKEETGYTPHEYIVKTRINKAKIMLKSTDMSIKEIAFSCGFSTESSFSNCFRKNTNITAVEFRKAPF